LQKSLVATDCLRRDVGPFVDAPLGFHSYPLRIVQDDCGSSLSSTKCINRRRPADNSVASRFLNFCHCRYSDPSGVTPSFTHYLPGLCFLQSPEGPNPALVRGNLLYSKRLL